MYSTGGVMCCSGGIRYRCTVLTCVMCCSGGIRYRCTVLGGVMCCSGGIRSGDKLFLCLSVFVFSDL